MSIIDAMFYCERDMTKLWALVLASTIVSTVVAGETPSEPIVDPQKDPEIIEARATLRDKTAARSDIEAAIKKLTIQINSTDADLLESNRNEGKLEDLAAHGRVENEHQQRVELQHQQEKCNEKIEQLKKEIKELKPRLTEAEAAEKTARDALNVALEPYAKVKADTAKREQIQNAKVFKLKNGKEYSAVSVVESDDGYTIKDIENHFHTFAKSDVSEIDAKAGNAHQQVIGTSMLRQTDLHISPLQSRDPRRSAATPVALSLPVTSNGIQRLPALRHFVDKVYHSLGFSVYRILFGLNRCHAIF